MNDAAERTYTKVCTLDDVWEGDMESFEVNGVEVLIVVLDGGRVVATQSICPHQNVDLVEGEFDGQRVLTCKQHLWQFDVSTGKGINPEHAAIAMYPVKVEGEDILVDLTGAKPIYCEP